MAKTDFVIEFNPCVASDSV